MPSWREEILNEFTPQSPRLTLVSDPDGLLLEEEVQQIIQDQGYELLEFDDPVAFRFDYESKHRSFWDLNESTTTSLVLRCREEDLRSLPYDFLTAGRLLSFTLSSLFPNLNYHVISTLDRSVLDKLYQSYLLAKPQRLGENATKDFVLLHLWEFVPELIKEPVDFLRLVIRLHYSRHRMPSAIEGRMVQVLTQTKWLIEWPVDAMVRNREFCFSFLQERWPLFLTKLAETRLPGVREDQASYALEIPGPRDVPFDHKDLRPHVDTLFLEGWLKAVNHPDAGKLGETWAAVGLKIDPQADRLHRLGGLLGKLQSTVPEDGTGYQGWLDFALRWAEAIALRYQLEDGDLGCLIDKIASLSKEVDTAFLLWTQNRYGGLHNQPAIPPVMLHHIPKTLAEHLKRGTLEKVALLVVDGLALDQWIVLRNELVVQRPDIISHEDAVYAWIPTITSVSRQSIFAGKAPYYFPSSIQTTNKEPALWTEFWIDQGLDRSQVKYMRGVDDTENVVSVKEIVTDPRVRVIGIVINKIDDIMHGMELGTRGMHNQVNQWARGGTLAQLLDVLFDYGFSVFLTSDHGNIESEGLGRLTEGSVADVKGQRVRVYPNQILRSNIKTDFPEAIEWPSSRGLPSDYLALIAPGRSAYVPIGERPVVHGGITLEEVVVPFVQLERRGHAS